jgi:hypothetical protein
MQTAGRARALCGGRRCQSGPHAPAYRGHQREQLRSPGTCRAAQVSMAGTPAAGIAAAPPAGAGAGHAHSRPGCPTRRRWRRLACGACLAAGMGSAAAQQCVHACVRAAAARLGGGRPHGGCCVLRCTPCRLRRKCGVGSGIMVLLSTEKPRCQLVANYESEADNVNPLDYQVGLLTRRAAAGPGPLRSLPTLPSCCAPPRARRPLPSHAHFRPPATSLLTLSSAQHARRHPDTHHGPKHASPPPPPPPRAPRPAAGPQLPCAHHPCAGHHARHFRHGGRRLCAVRAGTGARAPPRPALAGPANAALTRCPHTHVPVGRLHWTRGQRAPSRWCCTISALY